VQYKRFYNVIPANASFDRAAEIFLRGWREGCQTAGGSYDDAGVGDLEQRIAVLWDIPVDEQAAFLDFYAEHYPGVEVRFAGEQPEEQPVDWSQYLLAQGDPRWGNHVYADGQCYTLAAQGCFISCCAMAQRILGIDEDATPLTVDQTLGAEGYNRCLLLHSAMREKLGLDVTTAYSGDLARQHLERGGVIFIEVQPSSMMHFVVGVDYQDGDFLVLDPWKNKVAPLKTLYAGAESFRLIERYGTAPAPAPVTPVAKTTKTGQR
jgi:hypothetical protein